MNLRNVPKSRVLIIALGAMLLVAVFACGGGDGGGASATPLVTTAAPAGPGTITLTSTAIQGRSGKILLVYAAPVGGGARLARLCAGIDSDSFTLSAMAMTDVPSGNDPCGGNTAQTTFAQGTYEITAAVFTGGQQTPEAQVKLNVEVKGSVTAQIDGGALSG